MVLFERSELTAGSTWHAAGNCARFSHSPVMMRIRDYSIRLYESFNETLGGAGVYKRTGGLRPARDRDRCDEYRYVASIARTMGFELAPVGLDEMKQLHPLLNLDGYLGGLFDAAEGNADPNQVTQVLSEGARRAGASIVLRSPVVEVLQRRSLEWEVRTPEHAIVAEILVNAAGLWAREVASLSGLSVPIVPMQHQYLVTERLAELDHAETPIPLFRDCDESFYLRQEGVGLLVGPYEDKPSTWSVETTPPDFGMELLPPDLDRVSPTLEKAMRRVPALAGLGIKTTVNGAITFTADGHPLIGPAPAARNYYLFTGFNAGIMEGGGAGWMLAEWLVNGEPPYDLLAFDPRRFGGFADRDYVVARAKEIYPKTYAVGYPEEELGAGRPRKKPPIYARLAAARAVFGARYGWERANWFAPEGIERVDQPSFRRPNWFDAVAEECRAFARAVAVVDMTSFAKFQVSGADAARFLDRLSPSRIPRIGSLRLLHGLNARGGIECEFSVARLAEECFYLVAAAIAEQHHLDWLQGHKRAGERVEIRNVSESHGVLMVGGPRSRRVLESLTTSDLSNRGFPWLGAQTIEVAGKRLVALRVSYAGELGWELHHPLECQLELYDTIMDAGVKQGIRNVGFRALDSLRLEKGYPAFGTELTPEYTPFEAGLDRFVQLQKGDFVGRDALLERARPASPRRLLMLELQAKNTDAIGNEPVLYKGRSVGYVSSGGYGHRVRRSLAFAYMEGVPAGGPDRQLQVEILGKLVQGGIVATPVYDPNNKRLGG